MSGWSQPFWMLLNQVFDFSLNDIYPPVFLELFVLASGFDSSTGIVCRKAGSQSRCLIGHYRIGRRLPAFAVWERVRATAEWPPISVIPPLFSLRNRRPDHDRDAIMSIDYADTFRAFCPADSRSIRSGRILRPTDTYLRRNDVDVFAIDFILIFVSLELVTISFYVLVAYTRKNAASLEAGVKYLILGALSTGFLVYGITWIYGITRHTNFRYRSPPLDSGESVRFLFGGLFVLVGLGFKMAAAPFQFWVPDVYQGAPTPITAFLSVGSKSVGFIVLLRVVETFQSFPAVGDKLIMAIVVLAAATLIYGNFAAVPKPISRGFWPIRVSDTRVTFIAVAASVPSIPGWR